MMKNRGDLIWKEGIITTIMGAVLGVIITYFTDNLGLSTSKINIKWIILLFLLALTLLLLSLIFIRINVIKEEQIKLFTDTFYGFRAVEDDISEFAIRKLRKCSITRIVGTARQESIEKNDEKSASEYLTELEKKISGNKYFVCKRVTSANITSDLFKKHIKRCVELSANKGNVFEAIYVNQFDFNISYQLFDDTGLLLIVDNLLNKDYLDNSLGLWTENKEIIKAFINRFDYGWEKLKEEINNVPIKSNNAREE